MLYFIIYDLYDLLKGGAWVLKKSKTILLEKLRESLASVLPITGIVFLLCFTVVPVPTDILMAFVIGAALLILGMGLFTLGTDLAMTPIGEEVGAAITKSRKIWFIVLVCLVVGIIITVAEPDLQVLASQVPNIPNLAIILSVAVGVGMFLVLAMLRIIFRIRLTYLLIGFYVVVFILTQFVPGEFIAVAFDSGGVTTGPMTVPFIMALGVGAASMRTDKNAESDSFGLVALCSIGPILAVLILGMLYKPQAAQSAYTPVDIPQFADSRALWRYFGDAFPDYLGEVALALLPVLLFFILFQLTVVKLKRAPLIRILIGLVYTFVGLVLFLTGVNVGFMPVGNYIGERLGGLSYNWIVVPIGMLIGYFIVAAEPAVHVLNKQVFELTSGTIPKQAMSTSLSIGVCISVGLAMLRILLQIPILWLLLPGYAIAIVLSFFVPSMFTAIAFDSGGVASGPMTATFLLPLAMGACLAVGGSIVEDAFGIVAMVAMTPLITIQILGVLFQLRKRRAERRLAREAAQKEQEELLELLEEDVIAMNDEDNAPPRGDVLAAAAETEGDA